MVVILLQVRGVLRQSGVEIIYIKKVSMLNALLLIVLI